MSTRVTHPALGPCTECGSERVEGLADDGAVVAVRCETCGLVLSMSALLQARAALAPVVDLVARRAHREELAVAAGGSR